MNTDTAPAPANSRAQDPRTRDRPAAAELVRSLIVLMASPPALAKPMILGLDAWADSMSEEKSEAFRAWRTEPSTLPP